MFFLVLLYFLISIICAIICVGLYYQYNPVGREFRKIPGPKALPVFGNVFDYILSPGMPRSFALATEEVTEVTTGEYISDVIKFDALFKYMRDMYAKFKGIHKVHGFHLKVINIYDPDDLETILSATRFNNKRLPYVFLTPWLGEGLLLSNGDKWHDRRKMLTPAFHFKILKKFLLSITEHTEEFLDIIQQEVGKEKTKIQPLVTTTTLRIICETSMGTSMHQSINSVANVYFKAINIIAKCIIYRLCRIWIFPKLIFQFTKAARVQKKALKDLHKFTEEIIKERREFRKHNNVVIEDNDDEVYGKKNRMAMLDLLLEQEKLGAIDSEGIKEEVNTFMFEGHDTTSSALCFMIMSIANEKEIQNLIYEELHSIFGDSKRTPTIEDLNSMKYLECCIKESLRLYPSVPFISRFITEEVVLSGHKIPASTECNINIFDVHRNADLYPEPEKFNPERFLPEIVAKRHPYAYIPFSAGSRNCIGQKFAMMELKTVMSGLLRRFRLEPVTRPEDLTFTTDLVLRSVQDIYVRFCNRQTL